MNNEAVVSDPIQLDLNPTKSDLATKNILICDTQPVAVEGMKWLIENTGDLKFAGSVGSLEAVYAALNPGILMVSEAPAVLESAEALEAPEPAALEAEKEREAFASDLSALGEALGMGEALGIAEVLDAAMPVAVTAPVFAEQIFAEKIDAVVIDKSLGFAGVIELLQKLTANSHPTPAVVWGSAITEGEALRLLQAGAKGIVRRTSGSATLLDCLRTVTAGGTWMEDGIFGSPEKLFNPRRSQLTSREREVVVLVEKGLRNRDIARLLGIQTGTVKIHLKHIFEKTGVRGRYGLAFTGLQKQGSIAVTSPPQYTA